MEKTPHDIFLRELDSVQEVYVLSLWAYKFRETAPTDKFVVHNPDGTLSVGLPGSAIVGKYRNIGHLKAELRSGLPRDLRSVLYIRVISALEVFLIDSIKHAFTRNPSLLASQKRLEIPHSRLIAARTVTELQWEIVQKETRRLHSAGFTEVAKFFSSQLGINLSETGINLARLEKAHDLRHLLVHRLGHTDEQYREKYGVKLAKVYVMDQDLTDLINECRTVAIRLSSSLEDRIDAIPRHQGAQAFVGEITVRTSGGEMPAELLPDFCFIHGDQYCCNGDIFKLHRSPDGSLQYVFHCLYEHYAIIRRKLKKAAKKGVLEIRSIKDVSGVMRKRSTQSKDYLLKVATMMPRRRDWPKGVHKTLASILGISNGKASRIVASILEDEDCLRQLGKEVHEDFKANIRLETTDDLFRGSAVPQPYRSTL